MSYPDHASRAEGDLSPLVITYHYVRPRNSDGVTGITPAEFERQLKLVAQTRRFVTAEEFAESVDRTGEGPVGSALVTFDDAVRDQFEHALPVLTKLSIPAVFYAPMRPFDMNLPEHDRWTSQHLLHALAEHLGWEELERRVTPRLRILGFGVPGGPAMDQGEIDRLYHYEEPRKRRLKYALAFAMSVTQAFEVLSRVNDTAPANGAAPGLRASDWFITAEQLRALQAAGHSIGGHGFDHAALGVMPAQEQEHDLRRAQRLMDGITGRAWRTMAYPFGSASAQTEKIAHALGYSLCFTTKERVDCKYLEERLEQERTTFAIERTTQAASKMRRAA